MVTWPIFLVLVFYTMIMPHHARCENIVTIGTEKAVYTESEPVYITFSLKGLEPGRPVDLSVALEFPSGEIAFLGEGLTFSFDNPVYLVTGFPFSPIDVRPGVLPLQLAPELNFFPGSYALRAEVLDSRTGVMLSRKRATFVLANTPYLERVVPDHGITGEMVEIGGLGFGQDPDLVKVIIGGREATIMEITNTSVKTWVPYGASTGSVTVMVNGIESNTLPFQVGPYIESLSDVKASPGGTLTIYGFNFDPDKNKNIVDFNGIRGTVIKAKEDQLTVLVPEGNTGPLTVTASDMTSSPVDVTITPVVESIDPPRGEAGDIVTISGRNFSPVATNNYVVFNAGSTDEFAAAVLEASTNQLVVKVPESETGPVRVYTSGEAAQGDLVFTYPPEVDTVEPQVVVAGDTITITGRNFDMVKEKNAVLIGEDILTVVSSGVHTLTCKLPFGIVSGELKVVVNAMESKNPVFVSVIKEPLLKSISPREINATDTRQYINVTGIGFTKDMTLTLTNGESSVNANYTLSDYTGFSFSIPRGLTPGTYGVRVERTISGRTVMSNVLELVVGE